MTGAPAATPPLAFGDHIVFVDESGDHSLTSINPDYPVFVLAFCTPAAGGLRRADHAGRAPAQVRAVRPRSGDPS